MNGIKATTGSDWLFSTKAVLWTFILGGVSLLLPVGTFAQAGEIPLTFFGIHVNHGEDWPTFRFGSLRMWDDGADWDNIEKTRGTYNWRPVDRWVDRAMANGVEVLYAFGHHTPPWAAPSPTSPPNDLRDWDDFVTALVTRYRGKIKYYEGWNESNAKNHYGGSIPDLVTLQRHLYQIVRRIDPEARVLTSPPSSSSSSLSTGADWHRRVFAVSGGRDCDIVSFHGHWSKNPEDVVTMVRNLRNMMASYGLSSKPLWDTEGSWRTPQDVPDPDEQAAFVAKYYLLQWSEGVQRFFWYGWDYQPWGTLWDKNSGLHKPGVAYQEVEKWMVGATMNNKCSRASDDTWTCGLSRSGGYEAIAIWNPSHTKSYTAESRFRQWRDLEGLVSQISGSVLIGDKPILIETGSAF